MFRHRMLAIFWGAVSHISFPLQRIDLICASCMTRDLSLVMKCVKTQLRIRAYMLRNAPYVSDCAVRRVEIGFSESWEP